MILPSSSRELDLTVPTAWEQLTPAQYETVLDALSSAPNETAGRLIAFCRLAGITINRAHGAETYLVSGGRSYRINTAEFCHAVSVGSEWMTQPPLTPMRPGKVLGGEALNAEFHSVKFGVFLQAENLWQRLCATEDKGDKLSLLDDLSDILFEGITTHSDYSRTAAALWWAGLKNHLSRLFSNLYRPAAGEADGDLLGAMLAQVRALTGGDVTKEEAVLNVDTWTALAELDAKAKEAREYSEKYKK